MMIKVYIVDHIHKPADIPCTVHRHHYVQESVGLGSYCRCFRLCPSRQVKLLEFFFQYGFGTD